VGVFLTLVGGFAARLGSDPVTVASRKAQGLVTSPGVSGIPEWLEERARLIRSLIGLTDEQVNSETAPGQWIYRVGAGRWRSGRAGRYPDDQRRHVRLTSLPWLRQRNLGQ